MSRFNQEKIMMRSKGMVEEDWTIISISALPDWIRGIIVAFMAEGDDFQELSISSSNIMVTHTFQKIIA